MIRRPSAMANDRSAEARAAGNFVPVRRVRLCDRRANLVRQRRLDPLVGIKRKDPLTRCRVQRTVFLRAETWPIARFYHLGAERPGNIGRLVRTAVVDYDDLVGEAYGTQTAAERLFFVFGNHNQGKARRHGSSKMTGDVM